MKKYDDIEEIMREKYFEVPDVLDIYYDFEPSAADLDSLDYINDEAYIEENPKNAICALLEITSDEYDTLCNENNEYVKVCIDTYESLYKECGKEWNIFLESFIEAKENLPADTVDKMKKIAEIFERTEGYLPYENDHFYTLALLWYQEAAELGDASAQWSCINHWEEMTGWCPDNTYQNKMHWYEELAKNGDSNALAYLEEEGNWNEYEDVLAYLAGTGKDEYKELLEEEAEDGNEYAQKLLEENFYFEAPNGVKGEGIFTNRIIPDRKNNEEMFYRSLKNIVDAFTTFIREGVWSYGLRDCQGAIISDKNEWPDPIKENGEVVWIKNGERLNPVLWFGLKGEEPIDEWTISKDDKVFSDYHGEAWWKSFLFPKKRLYNWNILLGENTDYIQSCMFDEFEFKEPSRIKLVNDCPIFLDNYKNSSNESFRDTIDHMFVNKKKDYFESMKFFYGNEQ